MSVAYYSFLEARQNITADICCNQLAEMHAYFQKVRPAFLNRRDPILFHDNVKQLIIRMTLEKLRNLAYDTLPHPPYLPDLSPTH